MTLKYTISGDDLIVDIEENIENFKKEQKRGLIVGIILIFIFFIGIIAIIACSVRLSDVKNHPEKYEKKFEEKGQKLAIKKGKNLVITNRVAQTMLNQ